ncbi:MAG: hypothetical protein Kow0069_00630 [Promethearchaeota archaeon]
MDFVGVVDRGTNVVEVKPTTICNLRCRYCFVSAGKHPREFVADHEYLARAVDAVAQYKGRHELEVHVAPYGESLAYPEIFDLVRACRGVPGVEVVSVQTNGFLLDEENVRRLEDAGVTRVNVSVNTFDPALARYLACVPAADARRQVEGLRLVLESKVDLLLAPVWFPGKNDADVVQVIEYVKARRKEGYSERSVQIGVQKFLRYKHGRKFRGVREWTFPYFYERLRELEREHRLKLVLSPKDFGIHPRPTLRPPVRQGEEVKVEVVARGRSPKEHVARLEVDPRFAVKVLSRRPLSGGERLKVTLSKAKVKENLLVAAP